MKRRFTPEVTLEMLKELKRLVDDKKFTPEDFKIKYPSFYNFRKFIFSKGLMTQQFGICKWVSIEPNIYMAKELLLLYNSYIKDNNARYRENVKRKKLENKDFPKILVDIENKEVKKEVEKEVEKEPIFVDVEPFAITKHIANLELENEKLKNRIEFLNNELETLKEYNEAKNKKIAYLENKIENLEAEPIKYKTEPATNNTTPIAEFYRDLSSQERMSNDISTKTYKVLGITVFSITNKSYWLNKN
jgi:chaperonin cofactor prefoldin